MENIISLVHLQKSFGDHEVLRDINLNVKKGEVISDTPARVGEAATAHINAASEITNEYVVPPDEDYSAYVSRSDAPADDAEESQSEGGEN